MLMDRKITFDDYRGIIRALRDPEKGCPWDKAQTHESLKPCMIHKITAGSWIPSALRKGVHGTVPRQKKA